MISERYWADLEQLAGDDPFSLIIVKNLRREDGLRPLRVTELLQWELLRLLMRERAGSSRTAACARVLCKWTRRVIVRWRPNGLASPREEQHRHCLRRSACAVRGEPLSGVRAADGARRAGGPLDAFRVLPVALLRHLGKELGIPYATNGLLFSERRWHDRFGSDPPHPDGTRIVSKYLLCIRSWLRTDSQCSRRDEFSVFA